MNSIEICKEKYISAELLKKEIIVAIKMGDGLINGSWIIRKILELEEYTGKELENKIKDELSK